MKKTILLFFFFFALLSQAQNQQSEKVGTAKNIYLKANALFLPIGILNAGVEYQLKEKVTVQADVFISPWKSFAGKNLQVYMLGLEGRYYFKEAFQHWYVGGNISAARFIIQNTILLAMATGNIVPTRQFIKLRICIKMALLLFLVQRLAINFNSLTAGIWIYTSEQEVHRLSIKVITKNWAYDMMMMAADGTKVANLCRTVAE